MKRLRLLSFKAAVLAGLTLLLRPLPGFTAEKPDLFTDGIGRRVLDSLRPAYTFAEGVSDGVFDFLHLGSLRPETDSFADFESRFREKESRFLWRLREARDDRDWAGGEQAVLIIDTVKDTLLERYRVRELSRWATRYMKNPQNWRPGTLAAASIVGAASLYLNGAHTRLTAGQAELAVDLAAGLNWRKALMRRASRGRAIGLDLSRKGSALTFHGDWGILRGKLRGELYGIRYVKKF